MQAVWYEKEEISQPGLHVGEMPDVQAGCSRVRVKLHASGVVHGDTCSPPDWGKELQSHGRSGYPARTAPASLIK